MGHQEINMALSVGLRGARDERGCTRPLRILSVVSVAASETAQAFERGRGQIAQA